MGVQDPPVSHSPRAAPKKRISPMGDESEDGPLIDGEGKYGKRYKVRCSRALTVAAPLLTSSQPAPALCTSCFVVRFVATVSEDAQTADDYPMTGSYWRPAGQAQGSLISSQPWCYQWQAYMLSSLKDTYAMD